MNKTVALVLICSAFHSGSLWAQVPAASSAVKAPDAGSTWSMEIENSDTAKKDKAKDAPAPAPGSTPDPASKVELPVQLVIKSGLNNVDMGQITYSSGQQEIFYVADGCVLLPVQNTGQAYTQQLLNNSRDPFSLRVAPYPCVAWIAPANDKGMVKKNGFDCQHYAKVQKEQSGDLHLEAWIRMDNLYPVEVRVGPLTYHFDPVTSMPQNVDLPDAFRNALKRLKNEESAIDALQKANAAQK